MWLYMLTRMRRSADQPRLLLLYEIVHHIPCSVIKTRGYGSPVGGPDRGSFQLPMSHSASN